MLRHELQLRLKTSLNLMLKQHIEVLVYPIREFEQLLKEEKEVNPFIEDVYFSPKIPALFESKTYSEVHYKPNPIEILMKNLQAEMEGKDLEIAYGLISFTDERGYLKADIKDIANQLRISKEKVEEIRKRVMETDPIGVCSLNIKEFFQLQIRELYPEDPKLQEYVDRALAGEKIPPKVKEKLRCLKLSPLEPSPAPVRISKVDAVIELDEGELIGYIYDELIEIKPSKFYREIYPSLKGEVRKFLKEFVNRYEIIKRILKIRRENLRKILDEIIRVQADFLKGEGELKPLMAKELAYKIGVSESTISRIINSKYVKTPQGTYPFKFFFVRETAGGASQDQVMKRIKEIITSENGEAPLKDEEIADILRKEGFRIARRTVAKYRELLGIPSSRERRKR